MLTTNGSLNDFHQIEPNFKCFGTQLLRFHAEFLQQMPGHAFGLPQQSKQNVLHIDLLLIYTASLLARIFNRLFGARRQWKLARCHRNCAPLHQ